VRTDAIVGAEGISAGEDEDAGPMGVRQARLKCVSRCQDLMGCAFRVICLPA
jgi:hypothetical protein